MAAAFVQEFAIVDGDTSTTNYDAVAGELGRVAPDGLIVHTAGFDHDRGVFRIVDVWESREAGQLTRSSKRAEAQPKSRWRSVLWPILLSAVLMAL